MFGLMAGAIKSTTSAWSVGEPFTSWPLYVMVAVGLSGFLLNQHIYNQTRLPESLPMLNLVNPLVALTFGFVAFAERPRGSPLSLALECLGLTAVLVGIFVLGRTSADQSDVDGADHARGGISPGKSVAPGWPRLLSAGGAASPETDVQPIGSLHVRDTRTSGTDARPLHSPDPTQYAGRCVFAGGA